MAITHRTATRAIALQNDLQEAPYKFDFYAAIRQFECAHPEYQKLGESLKPSEDPLRLGQQPSMAFAPSTVSNFEPGSEGRPPRLETLFFGLFGPNGPLPLHLTEYARDRLHNSEDPTLSRFADIFHHRMMSLFYRAWANTQPTVNFDRPSEDRFLTYIGATCGYGMPSLSNRDEMPDKAKLHHAGILSNQTKSAEGLKIIISNFFGLPVRIQQFVGHWIFLPEDSQCRLGESPETGSLGMTTVVGAKVWDCQSKFRILLGPLKLKDFRRLLPTGDSFRRLRSIVKNYIGDELSWDLQLILEKSEVPPLKLGESAQLGWTTWSKSKPFERDATNLILDPYMNQQ